MAEAQAAASAQLSRYDALLSVTRTLATHTTVAELFKVLADRLHSAAAFDYLALMLHDETTDEMRLVVLEPADVVPPFISKPVAEQGPVARVWTTQNPVVIPIPEHGPLPPTLEFIRSQGRRVACFLPLTTGHRRLGVLSF
ncbi:MAG: hypothetical protein JF610_16815, partial [Acidobacteria bacterium]|nr:hypothetical protein [Acidobacteriota bacterium]